MIDDAVEFRFGNRTERSHFTGGFGIIKVEQDFTKIENDNFRFAHSGDLPAAFEGPAEREFVSEFNDERPHEAIEMKVPAEVYAPSSRAYEGLPEVEYPFHDRDALVTACGRICMHRKKINVSTVLAGQRLGITEVDDGIWLLSFMHYDLGYIDLEQRTLQTIDNPFGTRLSPMS